ncbi:MAG: 4Fe-4S binding protein [candidate division Zixibacteria bacterium]|nr:4Fe-4S binding protein [candidate division Zixibacteria bacterium]
MGVLKSFVELIRGLGIAGKHLGRHAITIQYPEEKWTMPEKSRGIVVLLSDKETGELNCTACQLCMRACPTAAIDIDAPRGEDKKRYLARFEVDHMLCCFCGLCVEACNFCAIEMSTEYEFSTLNKSDLIWDKDKLQEMGRNVDYVDTRKKKEPKTPPEADAATKPAEAKPDVAPASTGDVNPETKAAEAKDATSTDTPSGDTGKEEDK